MIDIVRLHRFIAQFQPQDALRIGLRPKPIHIARFEQRRDAV
jgi:hypothetical protein